MLSTEQTKALLGQPDMSKTEAESYRDACQSLVELIFEKWFIEKSNKVAKDENEDYQDDSGTTNCQ